ncbi:MAG TPA: DNA methyltransferase [Nitrososphaeraceae archaeon]
MWIDIPPIFAQAKERLGCPAEKPIALLERIVKSCSNEGDWVLDPFCGCGTDGNLKNKRKRNIWK